MVSFDSLSFFLFQFDLQNLVFSPSFLPLMMMMTSKLFFLLLWNLSLFHSIFIFILFFPFLHETSYKNFILFLFFFFFYIHFLVILVFFDGLMFFLSSKLSFLFLFSCFSFDLFDLFGFFLVFFRYLVNFF